MNPSEADVRDVVVTARVGEWSGRETIGVVEAGLEIVVAIPVSGVGALDVDPQWSCEFTDHGGERSMVRWSASGEDPYQPADGG